MRYNLKEILQNTSSYIFYKNSDDIFEKEYESTLLIDKTRELPQKGINTIFTPFRIMINDHYSDSFFLIKKALDNGVKGFFFDEIRLKEEKYYNFLLETIEQYKDKIDFIIMVPDTIQAIFDLARYTIKNKFTKDVKIITVTGSVGKTSTTEMIYAIFKEKYKIYRGEPMVNLRFRINQKIIEADNDVDFLLFECSGANRGYPKIFSELLTPDACVVTKVGTENLGIFKSLDNIANQKCELMTCLHENNFAVLNDSPEIRRASEKYNCKKIYTKEGDYELIKSDQQGSKFIYKNKEYEIPVVGVHQINNAMKAIEVANGFDVPYETIVSGLKKFQTVGSRWNTDNFNGTLFVSDCPNNPSYETMLSSITTFVNLYKNFENKRIAISGIRSLGNHEKKVHLDLAKFIAQQPLNEVICLESETKIIYEYLKENAPQMQVKYYDKPNSLDKDEPFVQYIINSLGENQAFLMKGQGIDPKIRYEDVFTTLKQVFNKK